MSICETRRNILGLIAGMFTCRYRCIKFAGLADELFVASIAGDRERNFKIHQSLASTSLMIWLC